MQMQVCIALHTSILAYLHIVYHHIYYLSIVQQNVVHKPLYMFVMDAVHMLDLECDVKRM